MSRVNNPLGLGKSELEKALEIHNKSIVFDCSNVAIVNPWLQRYLGEQFFDKMIEGGVTASNVTVPQEVDAGIAQGAKEFAAHKQWIDNSPEKALLVRKTTDIERAKREKKAAIIFGPQNANIVEHSLHAVQFIHDMGVRVMQVTYNTRNLIGDGCMEKANAGLSNFGIDVVQEMNKVGIVVDLSHSGDQTTTDAIEISKKPCICSHANARAICDHPRNKSDEQIKALAEKGGVICVAPREEGIVQRSIPREKWVVYTFEHLLKNVDHVIELVGIDHVSTASDINDNNETRRIWYRREHPEVVGNPEFQWYPIGFDGDLRKYAAITMALVSRGYSELEISKILGGNLMRVFRQVWID